jgi:uncharacterized UPF0160 family protein
LKLRGENTEQQCVFDSRVLSSKDQLFPQIITFKAFGQIFGYFTDFVYTSKLINRKNDEKKILCNEIATKFSMQLDLTNPVWK